MAERVAVTVSTFDQRRADGVIDCRRLTDAGRWWRAGKALAVVWLIALVAVLIPVAHFVLVPALLIVGPCVAAAVHRREWIVTGGSATCPVCRAAITLRGGAQPTGFTQPCPSCRRQLNVDPVAK